LIRILVVEDDQEKLRRVTLALTSVTGCSIDQIRDARDTNAAKRMLRDEQFDLLILDISIPLRSDQEPDRQGGLHLLSELLDRDLYRRPGHIVGLTAYEDTARLAEGRFRSEAFGLVRYDPSSRDWEETLSRKVVHIIASKTVETKAEFDIDLCVITALDDPELSAVLALDWNWQQRRFNGDGTVYHEGSTTGMNGSVRIIAASAARMGLVASAVLATKMTMLFRPRYLAMVGIAAGVKDQVEIGDILAADPSWNYESGKRHVKDGAKAFSPEPHQVAPDNIVRGSLSALARDQQAFDELRQGWKAERLTRSPALRIGPVGSGAAVLQDSSIVTEILTQHRKTIGVEMESYSIFVAAAEAPHPQPRAFSMKAVCDFANELKNDNHQAYAAYASAGALRLLVERYLPF
jgi:nucleoside phosphorylase/CheY-like chemotaxis protein